MSQAYNQLDEAAMQKVFPGPSRKTISHLQAALKGLVDLRHYPCFLLAAEIKNFLGAYDADSKAN